MYIHVSAYSLWQGDGRYLITNSKDQTIKLWDIRKFSNQEGVDATLRQVQQQSWDYRWENVPRRGELTQLSAVVMTYLCVIYGKSL